MAVTYKKLQHMLIERNISNSQLMRMANISAAQILQPVRQNRQQGEPSDFIRH